MMSGFYEDFKAASPDNRFLPGFKGYFISSGDKMFERYIATKYDLRPNTFHTYKYLYGHYVGDVLGKKKLAGLRYADMVHFYFI